MKDIEKILKNIEYKILNSGKEMEYTGMEYDSRKIVEGNIFAALDGSAVDGHDYIEKAVSLGARCILVSKEVEILNKGITYILVEDLRLHLGVIASNFYDWPQNKMTVIGITGTNGKTTTTYILEKLMGDIEVTRIGTVEYKVGNKVIPAPNTTPESMDLVKMCKESIDKNINYLIMEVSSHALEMGRVAMLNFDVAGFTNLTIDHLDFHKTVNGYFNAKRKLFLKLKDKSNGVYNIGDKFGKKLYDEFGGLSFGENVGDLKGKTIEITNSSQKLSITYDNKEYIVKTNLLGKFNMLNILTGLGICIKLGFDVEETIDKIKKIEGVPGRFEGVNCGQDFSVIVDYAHTGDGLSNILGALNEIKSGKIITIFGCGGNKGRDKRFGMGEASERLSDYTILSSDNPRTEPLESIMSDIEKAFLDKNNKKESEKYEIIPDRGEAIKKAIMMAKKGDIVLIAGKGHETTQTVGEETFDFDDRIVARQCLEEMLANI